MPDPVALQIKTPDLPNTLGNIMNIATQAQALKRAQATYDADVARSQAESSRSQTEASVAAQTAGPRVAQQQAATETAETTAQHARFRLQGEQAQKTFDSITALLKNPAVEKGDIEGSITALYEAKDRAIASGVPRATAEGIYAPFIMTAAHGKPGTLVQTLKTVLAQGMSPGGQVAAATPSGIGVTNQQQTRVVNTNPLAGPVGATIPGTEQQLQVPPTATTTGPGGQPTYVGPRAAGGAPIPAGNPPGLEASAAGTADTANKDWLSTSEAARTASADIANLQNIKRFAEGAAVGVGSDRRAQLAGWAGFIQRAMGMSDTDFEKIRTNTNLLAKNANMLALAGGDTNLAKTMAESANPNTTMELGAIREAANQVISQREMALTRQKFLTPYKALNDPNTYNTAVSKWNEVADPRIFQWGNMSADEKKEMKGAMSQKEQAEFRKKLEKAVELGIVK